MVGSRTATAAVGVVLSLLVSVGAWLYFDTLLLFLVVPFVPFLLRRRRAPEASRRPCPECGFSTADPDFTHCPYDGTRLE